MGYEATLSDGSSEISHGLESERTVSCVSIIVPFFIPVLTKAEKNEWPHNFSVCFYIIKTNIFQ